MVWPISLPLFLFCHILLLIYHQKRVSGRGVIGDLHVIPSGKVATETVSKPLDEREEKHENKWMCMNRLKGIRRCRYRPAVDSIVFPHWVWELSGLKVLPATSIDLLGRTE